MLYNLTYFKATTFCYLNKNMFFFYQIKYFIFEMPQNINPNEDNSKCQIFLSKQCVDLKSEINGFQLLKKETLKQNKSSLNHPKTKTCPPSSLLKIKKFHHYERLIHSNVSEVIMKNFIIELYRGVKYSLKSLKGPNQNALQRRRVQLKQKKDSTKKFLFLDLDETLIFTQRQKYSKAFLNQQEFTIHFRPYTQEFLTNISRYYDVYIFTAATKQYAKAVINKLNSKKIIIQDFLCRQNCFKTQKGKFIKDLRIVKNRFLKDMILIDNKPESFGLQIDNGIPILEFFGSKHDRELENLEKILVNIADSKDVRVNIQEHFQLSSLTQISKEELQSYLKLGKSLGYSETKIKQISNS